MIVLAVVMAGGIDKIRSRWLAAKKLAAGVDSRCAAATGDW